MDSSVRDKGSYVFGPFVLDPRRRVLTRDHEPVALTPTVFDLLLHLVENPGRVVTKDELFHAIWPGRVVSESSLSQAIFVLRRALNDAGGEEGYIATAPGRGYRFTPSVRHETSPMFEPADAQLPERPRPRRTLSRNALAVVLVSLLVVAAVVGATVAWLNRPVALATPLVEVRALSAIGSDPALQAFAASASDQIAAFLSDSNVRVVSPPSSGQTRSPKTQLSFSGAVSSAGGQMRLHLVLNDLRSDTELWSGDYVEPVAKGDALIDEAKGGAITTINLIRYSYGPDGLTLDGETNRLSMRGGRETTAATIAFLRDAIHDSGQALARAPDSGMLHGLYACSLSFAGAATQSADKADLLKRGRAEAERTIREFHDQSGLAYVAFLVAAQAQSPHDWVGNLARASAALKAAPEDAYLYGYNCDALRRVGRAADSLAYCQHAIALQPHMAPFLLRLAIDQDMSGNRPSAAALLDEGARLYPDFADIRGYRFTREAWTGSPDKALALLHDPTTAPSVPASYIAAAELLEKARKSGLASDADAAMVAIRDASRQDRLAPWRVFFPVALGRLDDAVAAPDIAFFETISPGTLTQPEMDRLRRDPRFWPIAAKAGLVRYWLTTDKWPDFCGDPTYPLNCRAEARRVAALAPSGPWLR